MSSPSWDACAQAGLKVIIQQFLPVVLPCPYIVFEFHTLVRSIFFFLRRSPATRLIQDLNYNVNIHAGVSPGFVRRSTD